MDSTDLAKRMCGNIGHNSPRYLSSWSWRRCRSGRQSRLKSEDMTPMAAGIPQTFDESEPAWEIALLFPAQGAWSEAEYLAISDSANRLIEFRNGRIKVLAIPTEEHQVIVRISTMP
jgi:hypothetical protein